jgi:hypothetical protein
LIAFCFLAHQNRAVKLPDPKVELRQLRDVVLMSAVVGFASGLSEGYRRGRESSFARIQEEVTVMRAQGQVILPSELTRSHEREVARSMARLSARWAVALPLFALVYHSLQISIRAVRDGTEDELNGTIAGAVCGAAVGTRLTNVRGWTAMGASIGFTASLFGRIGRYFEQAKVHNEAQRIELQRQLNERTKS